MALAFPEGECFFDRSGLRVTARPDIYDANNPELFHSNMMIEYLWNVPDAIGDRDSNHPSGHTHPRATYTIVRNGVFSTRYGNWTHLPVMYGPREGDIWRREQHELCTTSNVFSDYRTGGAAQSYFKIMPLPTEQERWIWFDLLACIRAIYIPLAFTADEHHEELCAWVQVNFARTRDVAVWRGGNSFVNHTCSSTYGLATHRGFTIGFDVQGLIQLLPLPRQLRKDNVYASRLIKIVNRSNIVINSSSFRPDNPRTYLRAWDISWLTVANANFGLDLQWKPAQGGGWLENFFKNVLTMALGAIPIFGPILAVVFPVAWTLIVDPDSAFEELRNLMPGIDFADRLIRQRILDSVDESKQYLPDGWEQLALPAQKPSTAPVVDAAPPQPVQTLEEIGTSLSFVMAGEVLAQTNKVPPNDELVDEEGDSIVELVNPPTDFPDETSEAATLPSDG